MQSCESKFLKDRPHSKGLINRIMFTPWDDPCFITSGCDHAVVLWREQQRERNAWKSRLLHKDLHSSSVMGVAGMRHNNLVLSCGDDRRFVGFDAGAEKTTFQHKLDNRCTNLLPNPRDVNLVMVHTRYKANCWIHIKSLGYFFLNRFLFYFLNIYLLYIYRVNVQMVFTFFS